MSVLLCATCMQWPQRSKESMRGFPRPRVTEGCEPPCGCWKLSLGPPQEYHILDGWAISPIPTHILLQTIPFFKSKNTSELFKDGSSKHIFWLTSWCRDCGVTPACLGTDSIPQKLENLGKEMQLGHKWNSTLNVIWVKKPNQDPYDVQLTRGLSNTSHLGRNSMEGICRLL